jgi:putative copper export protein
VLLSWSGHAASGSDATLGVAIDVVHGWATAAWLGGLVMLLVLCVPLLAAMPPRDRVCLGAAAVVRFSSLAVAAVVLLVITGVYRALAELPSLDALWSTDYGLVLLAKLVVFAVMLVIAAWNRAVLHPRLEREALGLGASAGAGTAALRRSVRAEVALGAVVMALVAVMVGLMPPT